MTKILICTIKSWNIDNAVKFITKNRDQYDVRLIDKKENLNAKFLRGFDPDYIFFPHWSWIVPKEIYSQYTCILFHMTDLPFGRGGSPLQNLIARGMTDTKISAVKMTADIDAGPIYLKRDLNLYGTADEIFIRASNIIFFDMIPSIIEEKLDSQTQVGEIVEFKRRTPLESKLQEFFNMQQIYNHIRMLDGEDYPKAFLDFGCFRIYFSRASLHNKKIVADVEIIEKATIGDGDNE